MLYFRHNNFNLKEYYEDFYLQSTYLVRETFYGIWTNRKEVSTEMRLKKSLELRKSQNTRICNFPENRLLVNASAGSIIYSTSVTLHDFGHISNMYFFFIMSSYFESSK